MTHPVVAQQAHPVPCNAKKPWIGATGQGCGTSIEHGWDVGLVNPKKTKEKERRRARKLAQEAWDAADAQNLDLAEKIIRRAVATQSDNPVLWNDQGMVLRLRGKEREAEEAFRTALSLAPTYAEPYGHLAEMRARQGHLRDAVRLLEQAVQHGPQEARYAERLEAYRALIAVPNEATANPSSEQPTTDAGAIPPTEVAEWEGARRVAALDWSDIEDRLSREGCVLVPALLDAPTCAELRGLFEKDSLFAKTVVMDREDFGNGVYRYFQAPLPAVVDQLRRAIYPALAAIANHWQRLLNETEEFPEDWEAFRRQCAEAGQTVPTPILLRYGPGGFNALHRDLRGSVYFPIQLAVVLSPRADSSAPDAEGFCGGEFLFCDVPAGKKARRRVLAAGLGDAVLFCTRDRLVRVGGAHGLQPVKHGVNPITSGDRVVLGVPFHEYR
jgi:hypothetical protein